MQRFLKQHYSSYVCCKIIVNAKKGRLPIALSCEQAEVKVYLVSWSPTWARHSRKQEIDSVNQWRALAVTKRHFFPLTVSLWFQFRGRGRWKPQVEEELLQSALSHRWALGWELRAACGGLDGVPPGAGRR